MIAWRAEGALLAARRHGENDAIVQVFTEERGRCAAVVKGGAGRRMAPVLQPGAQIAMEWRARLDEHLGVARVEPVRSRAAALMDDGAAWAALSSIAALLCAYLPEREPNAALYQATLAMLDMLGCEADWPESYARWELGLLSALGFRLDLSTCAATGARDGLVWVSPKSGRAVSAEAGAPYADKLLALPAFLRGEPGAPVEMAKALTLTGWFLNRDVAAAHGLEAAPAARERFAARFVD